MEQEPEISLFLVCLGRILPDVQGVFSWGSLLVGWHRDVHTHGKNGNKWELHQLHKWEYYILHIIKKKLSNCLSHQKKHPPAYIYKFTLPPSTSTVCLGHGCDGAQHRLRSGAGAPRQQRSSLRRRQAAPAQHQDVGEAKPEGKRDKTGWTPFLKRMVFSDFMMFLRMKNGY